MTAPAGAAWLDLPEDTPFSTDNLPLGVFSTAGASRRVGVAIGNQVLDLSAALGDEVFSRPSLNAFLALGRAAWARTRADVRELLTEDRHRHRVASAIHDVTAVTLHLPVEVADYVDFYSSLEHAGNLGRMFRPQSEPLTPNWRHLPIGYHGRAGTMVVSGTPVVRPRGLRCPAGESTPVDGPSERLDIEAEVGFIVGVGSALGERVSTAELARHVFGAVLVNDWSARDIQAFEYVPLGPFLGKSFATTISPWVVPMEALEAARVDPPAQDPQPAKYLRRVEPWGLDITLEVRLNGDLVSRPPFAGMYWTPDQQLAHLTASGASLRTGDLFASGTVSGGEREQRGSLMELSWNGTEPIQLADGTLRTFLRDGDSVSISATAPGPAGRRLGFGEAAGTVLPSAAGRTSDMDGRR